MPIIDPTDEPLPTNPFIVEIMPPYSTGYELQPNQVYCFPVIVLQNQRTIFNLLHTSLGVQDFTIATSFSTKPYNPVLFYPNRTYKIHLLKRKALQFALQDITYAGSQKNPPAQIRTILVEPGNMYYFNVENLTGHINKFDFIFDLVTLGP
jgi:hypothetical protein